MTVFVYGDFNCLYSYLASQRMDALAEPGAVTFEWRAVERDRTVPLTGRPSADGQVDWNAGLAAAAALAQPGETPPAKVPTLVSNTSAAVAAYAEAVSDGVQDELRRRLFAAVWAQGRHVSRASDVQRIVSGLLWTAGPGTARLSCPDLPGALGHDPDLMRIMRRSGGIIAQDGGPVTTAAHQRIREWRRAWLALAGPVTPAVAGEDGTSAAGPDVLDYLAGLRRDAGSPQPTGPG